MQSTEATDARVRLGLSHDELAAETGLTPAVVAAWESGHIKVPSQVAADLRWRIARLDRQDALATSGLPECDWITAFEAEAAPHTLKEQSARLDRALAHVNTCETCVARDAFVGERFPPMPPAPQSGWLSLVLPVVERVERLPPWARPAAIGAMLFVLFSLFKLLFFLPSIVRDPGTGLVTAAQGIALSATIGAGLGLLYGQYQRLRARWAARGAA